ncbi:MAG: hypothetical protein MHPSP_001159 [Paramarteilia canceri]
MKAFVVCSVFIALTCIMTEFTSTCNYLSLQNLKKHFHSNFRQDIRIIANTYWYHFNKNNPRMSRNRLERINRPCLVQRFKCRFMKYGNYMKHFAQNMNYTPLNIHSIMSGYLLMLKSLEIYMKSVYPPQYSFFDPYTYIFSYTGKILEYNFFNSIDNFECEDKSADNLKSATKRFLESYKYHFYYIENILRFNENEYHIIFNEAAIFKSGYLKTLGILYPEYKIKNLIGNSKLNDFFDNLFQRYIRKINPDDYNRIQCPNTYPEIDGIIILIYDYLINNKSDSFNIRAKMEVYCKQIPSNYLDCFNFEICKNLLHSTPDDDNLNERNNNNPESGNPDVNISTDDGENEFLPIPRDRENNSPDNDNEISPDDNNDNGNEGVDDGLLEGSGEAEICILKNY